MSGGWHELRARLLHAFIEWFGGGHHDIRNCVPAGIRQSSHDLANSTEVIRAKASYVEDEDRFREMQRRMREDLDGHAG